MPLSLSPATPSDIPPILSLQNQIFHNKPFFPILFPNGYTRTSIAGTQVRYISEITSENSVIRHLKVSDSELDDEIVGTAIWKVYAQPKSEGGWKGETGIECADEGTRKMLGRFVGILDQKKREWIAGKAHCFLYIVGTNPAHQRRGIGKMLVQWGCDEADRLGLPAFLEASKAGHALYESCGFEDREKVVVGKEVIGEYGPFEYTFMERPASGIDHKDTRIDGVCTAVEVVKAI